MSDADRIVRARRDQQAQTSQQNEQAKADTARADREAGWEDIKALIKPALDSLERRGFPGGKMIVAGRKPRLLRGPKVTERAAWLICKYDYQLKDARITSEVLLVSDETIAHGYSSLSFLNNAEDVRWLIEANGPHMEAFPFQKVKDGLRAIAEGQEP